MKLNFSNGELSKFKKRNLFKNYRLFGESGEVNIEATISELPKLQKKVSGYSITDVFDADEFGLFYRLASDSSIGPSRLAGKKKKKERLSLLARLNDDGIEKLPLAFIGKWKKPKFFGRKTGSELGFNYHFNSKSWIRTGNFLSGLNHLIYVLGEPEIEKHFYK